MVSSLSGVGDRLGVVDIGGSGWLRFVLIASVAGWFRVAIMESWIVPHGWWISTEPESTTHPRLMVITLTRAIMVTCIRLWLRGKDEYAEKKAD